MQPNTLWIRLLFTIGTVGEHPSPVIVKDNFHNVPETGLVASWDLGFPGTADPEQFFFR